MQSSSSSCHHGLQPLDEEDRLPVLSTCPSKPCASPRHCWCLEIVEDQAWEAHFLAFLFPLDEEQVFCLKCSDLTMNEKPYALLGSPPVWEEIAAASSFAKVAIGGKECRAGSKN